MTSAIPVYAEIHFKNGSRVNVVPTSLSTDFHAEGFSKVALDGYIYNGDFESLFPASALSTATVLELISEIKQRVKTKENLK